jgi:hypothetical protein
VRCTSPANAARPINPALTRGHHHAHDHPTGTTPINEPIVDGDRLMAFVFRAVGEIGATLNTALVVMGDRLGSYRALAGTGPTTPAEHRLTNSIRFAADSSCMTSVGEGCT